jgi:hypothetical protein
MPRSNGKHLLIANSYTLLLISLRFAGPDDSGYRPPRAQREAGEDGGEARRWRAYLTVVGEDEPEEVAVDCPECAKAGVRGLGRRPSTAVALPPCI